MQIMQIPGARTASQAELEAVPSPSHIAVMQQKALQDAPCLVADFEEPPDNTTYMAKSSFEDALQVRINPLHCDLAALISLPSREQACAAYAPFDA